MSARNDAATLLERALLTSAGSNGVTLQVRSATMKRWASATFVGARHVLAIEGDWRDAVSAWLRDLPEIDLPIRGHLVADLAVVEQAHADGRFTATLEILTVEAA